MSQIAPKAPITRKDDIKETYFGNIIEDPYRWLENDLSEETASWVSEQNKHTQNYLSNIPFLSKIKIDLTEMWNYEKYSSPYKEGPYYLFYKNNGLQNQSILYIQQGLNGKPEVLINPNTINEKGTSAIGTTSMSKKQQYFAYSVSDAGSDWQSIYIMDVKTKKLLNDTLKYIKFSSISWVGDEGFYYGGYDRPINEKEKYSAKTQYQKIFYHKIGTPQSSDELIYEDTKNPLRYKGVSLSEDERWLMLSISEGTDGNILYYKDLKNSNTDFKSLAHPTFDVNQDIVENINGKFLIHTNRNAPFYKVILIDPNTGTETDFIKEKEWKLDAVSRVGNFIFCKYLANASSKVHIYTLEGKYVKELKLPNIGTVSGFTGSAKDDHTFYSFSTFNEPTTIYKYDLKTGVSTLFKKTKLKKELKPTTVKQIWFTSKDGTQVPMFIYHRTDIDITKGPHPVFLYGYGGFNISLTPSFGIPLSYFVQQGGIYVSVSLRGGSEFGENWHKQGMLDQKQNVFDDFISAAEYLINENITSAEKLAIHGRSNGGLLVGACMTQRPELFKVALPGVGVLDMLRYHKFTVGWGWAVEYGSSNNESQYNYLIKYSPLHNLKPNTKYPSTLITTADHDDRVVPAHSFKFAAQLQATHNGTNPVLIRIDTQAGHGAGKPTAKQIDEWADVLGFTMNELGMNIQY